MSPLTKWPPQLPSLQCISAGMSCVEFINLFGLGALLNCDCWTCYCKTFRLSQTCLSNCQVENLLVRTNRPRIVIPDRVLDRVQGVSVVKSRYMGHATDSVSSGETLLKIVTYLCQQSTTKVSNWCLFKNKTLTLNPSNDPAKSHRKNNLLWIYLSINWRTWTWPMYRRSKQTSSTFRDG